MRGVLLLALLAQVAESPARMSGQKFSASGRKTRPAVDSHLLRVSWRWSRVKSQTPCLLSVMLSEYWKPQRLGDAPRCRGGPAPSGRSGQSEPTLAKEMIASALAHYAQALEYDPKLEPADAMVGRPICLEIPPPPGRLEEGEDQDGSSDSTNTKR